MVNALLVFACQCAFYYYWNRWLEETERGRNFKAAAQAWKPGVMGWANVIVWGVVAIMVMGLAPVWLGCNPP